VIRQLLVVLLGLAGAAGALATFVLAFFAFLAALNLEFILLTIAALAYTFACGYVASNLQSGTPGPWAIAGLSLIAAGIGAVVWYRLAR
jgi:hypothetical protein